MIPTLPFGKTGHESTRIIFGAAALGAVTQSDADRTLDVLMRYSINHIDVAASYGDAELRIGPWMDRYRDSFFLATKTGMRDRKGAREEIRRSLERLRVSQIDLIQFHNLVDPVEWDQVMNPGGALEAALEAREEGLVRFIGVTGHGTPIAGMHLRSIDRFPFSSVLLPYNYAVMQDPGYAQDFNTLLEKCERERIAVQTIKSIARRPWGGQSHTRSTWYQPLEDQSAIDHAVHWVLARPAVFLNTASDIDLLPHILEAAARFDSESETAGLENKLAELQMESLFV